MTYPNILTYKGNGLVQYTSNTEFESLADVVLKSIVTANAVGTLQSTTDGSFTAIGTFTDNFIVGDPGDSDTTVTDTAKVFYQDLNVSDIGPSATLPVFWDGTDVRPAANNSLPDQILQHLVTNDGPGTYFLGTSAPSDGGTWSQAFSIVDQVTTNTTASPVAYVWVKTDDATTYNINALKVDETGLKYMSEGDIQSIASSVRQRIIDTGIGTYALQVSAPGTGTWEAKGTIEDTQATTSVNPVGYVGVTPTFNQTVSPAAYVGTAFVPVPVTYVGSPMPLPGPSDNQGYLGGPTNQFNYLGSPVRPAAYSGFGPSPQPAVFYGTQVNSFFGTTPATFTGSVPVVSPSGTTTTETLTLWRRIA
jgi:hypothetical protein